MKALRLSVLWLASEHKRNDVKVNKLKKKILKIQIGAPSELDSSEITWGNKSSRKIVLATSGRDDGFESIGPDKASLWNLWNVNKF